MAGFSKAVVSFDAAEFGAVSDVNPLELLPAPGAGKYIAVRNLDVIMIKATRVWEVRGNPVVALGTQTATSGLLSIVLGGGFNSVEESTVGVGSAAPTSSAPSWIFGADEAENQPLTFGLSSANPGPLTPNGGPILAASVADGGSGYAPGDTGRFVDNPDGWGFDANYVVDTVDGGGAVLTFTITAPGTGYGAGETTDTDGGSGSGSGFTALVTSVAPGDSPVKFIVYYTIEDL